MRNLHVTKFLHWTERSKRETEWVGKPADTDTKTEINIGLVAIASEHRQFKMHTYNTRNMPVATSPIQHIKWWNATAALSNICASAWDTKQVNMREKQASQSREKEKRKITEKERRKSNNKNKTKLVFGL